MAAGPDDSAPGGPFGASEPRPVRREDIAVLSASLARAFEDDPVSRFLLPRWETHARRLERYFAWQIRHVFLPRGESWTTPELRGASLWIPSGRRHGSAVVGLLQLPSVLRILGRHTGRALALVDKLESVHPKAPHHYLGTIGVDPARQRQGVGSALMTIVLDRLDAEGIPSYLESSKEKNLAFYHRHGYEVTTEVGGEKDGIPHIWCMWREPKTGDASLTYSSPENRSQAD